MLNQYKDIFKIVFYYEQDDKPGYVMNGHLSRPIVTNRFKQPTRKQTGRLMLSVRFCFKWGLHMPP